ncbi:MAG: T9SS type A sorting domain-containing protein [Saprospiraceae bacterium]|nr:T9SS type A sorting domain-containing protein [Saprospiraceae bacterium]MCB9319656.1 T9SS type A sorting domain-containing protein [Lewinellaceae bacterium]
MTKSNLLIIMMGLLIAAPAFGHVHLKYPEGGEHYMAGEQVMIRWEIEIPHDQKDWDLYFTTDGGTTWNTIIENLPVTDTSYQWVVPGVSTTHAKIKVVQDNNTGDYEDNSGEFTIGNATAARNDLLERNWKIYPNPSHGEDIHIVAAHPDHRQLQSIYLVDEAGRELWRGNASAEDWILPVPAHASGIYFLVVRYPREIRQQKLTIVSSQ